MPNRNLSGKREMDDTAERKITELSKRLGDNYDIGSYARLAAARVGTYSTLLSSGGPFFEA